MGPSASQYPNTQPRDISCFADRRATSGSVVGELGGEYDRRASQRLVVLPLLRALGIAFCGVAEQGGIAHRSRLRSAASTSSHGLPVKGSALASASR